jgi:uncharacterized protein (TIGR02594 family)
MCGLRTTAFRIAQRFVGMKEVNGLTANPMILAMLRLDAKWPEDDEVPWCSAFVNYVAWLLRLPRSKSLRARSWLKVGNAVHLDDARPGFDVVILWRGKEPQPGPQVIDAPGHVGFYAGRTDDEVFLLGGNQGDEVRVSPYSTRRILGIRRLRE